MGNSSSNQGGKTTYGRQKQNLTLFGRWIEALNVACQTNQVEIALRAHMQKSMLSKVTRGQSTIRRTTVLKLLHVYEVLAQEREVTLPENWQAYFFLAWSDDDSLMKGARIMVERLELMNKFP